MLRDESGISLERIRSRGYRTITEEESLEELGFADFQIRIPALFIPIRNISGELVFYRIRPDDPRVDPKKPWKVTKYEHPAGVPLTLDIPQFTRENLSDTARRL